MYWKHGSFFPIKRRISRTMVESGVSINSFNPPHLDFFFNLTNTQLNSISIISNNVNLLQISPLSEISIVPVNFSDGYHHLDILMLDDIHDIEFYQQIDISTGNQTLRVTILNEDYEPVKNISVHLELSIYSHITAQQYTNQFGEVTFNYLSRNSQVYVEAISMATKRYAFSGLNTLKYQNITLILEEMNSTHYDEYLINR
ncbi:unnamed protein product [Adineta steineri]|uniref:Uncharacterized protein n=1 Tax=Adineta steineri TaxID=433720 RepID=A0A815ILP1_9BILA|nr:unnamed protein product [Adineta steineri]CAF3928117.1 unnamed protein product [Adineta steineri]